MNAFRRPCERRQRAAVASFASHVGFSIVAEHYDAVVRGDDAIENRPGFSALLDQIEANGVRVVLVEDVTRLARKVLIQELAILALGTRGVRVIAANGDDLTQTDDEMKVAMRQIAGAFSQLEKTRLVKKLRAAREWKRAQGCKVEGRKDYADRDETKPLVALARRLYRRSPKTGKRPSLREVADEMASRGHRSATGRVLSPSVIKRMVGR